jgi:hypothetical protein
MGSGPDLRTFGDLGIGIVLGSEEDGAVIAAEGTWSLERDVEQVYSLNPKEPDPRWRFTDQAGHEHRWVGAKEARLLDGVDAENITGWEDIEQHILEGDRGRLGLPTLEWVVTGQQGFDDGCGCVDYIDEGEHRCRMCEQVVEPGYRDGPNPIYVAGPVRWLARVKMSHKDMMTIPRSWLEKPISVLTPAGRGQAHITAVEPDDSMGYLYEVTLRGIGGLTWEAPDDG